MNKVKLHLPKFVPTHEETVKSQEWSQMKKMTPYQAYGRVTSCHISHSQKLAAFAHSARVTVTRTQSNTKKFQISKFKDMVTCVKWRYDDKLLACGTKDGVVKIFDVHSKSSLKVLQPKTQLKKQTDGEEISYYGRRPTEPSVTCLSWFESSMVVTGNSQNEMSCYDLIGFSPLTTFKPQTDNDHQESNNFSSSYTSNHSINDILVYNNSNNLVSTSTDGFVRWFDKRAKSKNNQTSKFHFFNSSSYSPLLLQGSNDESLNYPSSSSGCLYPNQIAHSSSQSDFLMGFSFSNSILVMDIRNLSSPILVKNDISFDPISQFHIRSAAASSSDSSSSSTTKCFVSSSNVIKVLSWPLLDEEIHSFHQLTTNETATESSSSSMMMNNTQIPAYDMGDNNHNGDDDWGDDKYGNLSEEKFEELYSVRNSRNSSSFMNQELSQEDDENVSKITAIDIGKSQNFIVSLTNCLF